MKIHIEFDEDDDTQISEVTIDGNARNSDMVARSLCSIANCCEVSPCFAAYAMLTEWCDGTQIRDITERLIRWLEDDNAPDPDSAKDP